MGFQKFLREVTVILGNLEMYEARLENPFQESEGFFFF